MPKKTRREKIIAQLKRQLQKQNIQNIDKTIFVKQKEIITIPLPQATHRSHVDYGTYNYVFADLKRISFVTLLALVFEGFIYLILNHKIPLH